MKAFIMGALVSLFTLSATADWPLEERKIHFLISSVDQLEASFIRGGIEYTGKEAAKHLRRKFQGAMNNSTEEEIQNFTVIDFIEKIASKSMLTGEKYLIKFPNGEVITARDWLYDRLKYFEP